MHLTIEGLGTVNVQDLGRNVREALHIAESAQDAFAFWLCSPLLGRNTLMNTAEKITYEKLMTCQCMPLF